MSLVCAIDLGTSSVRAILFNKESRPVAKAQTEYTTEFPGEGRVEQDANVIWAATEKVLADVMTGLDKSDVAAIGITNQRETTVIWDKTTGEPYHNALVWSDTRTASMCARFTGEDGDTDRFKAKTGLPIIAYFSATKIRWLLENVPAAQAGVEAGNALFGTLDTWLIWKLTGGALHITDVTNASRTLLMSIHTLEWDAELLEAFDVSPTMLPEIRASSTVYGACTTTAAAGVPIAGILGDQQAALFGQTCFNVGDVKNTYGTGAFTMMNTGTSPVTSTNGLLTTVAYKLGEDAVVYALEGSVAVCGSLIKWLRDQLGLISSAKETQALAESVPDTAGVVVVPAFSGLFAPHWRPDARGVIAGLTAFAGKAHIVRAALESAAFQSTELIHAMEADAGAPMTSLRVDGGMVVNSLLMQFQADLINRTVVRPEVTETTALGAAYAAGLAVGFWSGVDDLRRFWKVDTEWTATITEEARAKHLARWRKGIERSLGWDA